MRKFLKKLLEWLRFLLGYQKEEAGQVQSGDIATQVIPPGGKEKLETEMLLEAKGEQPKYQKRASLFSYRERVFYQALARSVDWNRYDVFAKVRLADFTDLANQPEDQKYHRNRILCKHIDFLLCSKPSFAPVLAIELDDSSHKLMEHDERDKFKDNLFQTVGIPLLRMKLQSHYSNEDLRKEIEEKLREASS